MFSHCDLARHGDLGQSFGKSRERSWIISNEGHGVPEFLTGVGSDVVLQGVLRKLVSLHIRNRTANELLSCHVLEWLNGRSIDDLVEDAKDVGVIRRAAPNHKALEDSRMIRSCEETCWSSNVRCYHMRLVEAEGVHDLKNKRSHSLRHSHIF